MSQFHISRDGTSFGPYDEAQARMLFAQGNIAATDLVWRDGMASWLPASQVFGNAPARAVAMTPPESSAADPRYTAPPSWSEPTVPSEMPASTQVPMPPKLHWALVLLFAMLTAGLFLVVWIFIQTMWVKKIDPTSRATWFYAGYFALLIVGNATSMQAGSGLIMSLLSLISSLGSLVLIYAGMYSIRRSMIDYFNTVEPIGLRMSGIMTFFFSTWYFQHHMTRIARWKETGVLTPQ